MNLENLKRALKTGEGTRHQLEKLVEELAIGEICSQDDSLYLEGPQRCGRCTLCIATQAFEETCNGEAAC